MDQKDKLKYYSLKNLDSKNATYNIAFGERSNGKSYSVLYKILDNYVKTGETGCIIRRYREDYVGKNGASMLNNLVYNGYGENVVKKLTKGKFSSIYYQSKQWFLSNYDPDLDKQVHEDTPFCYGFALTDWMHDKSTAFPTITTVLFDEFITNSSYLKDEFMIFMNVISTILRYRDNLKIYMMGNSIDPYCPYFTEMGLRHIGKMKKGEIEVYTYGESGLSVAVEYSDSPNSSKPSDKYFAFDNPKLQMITGGAWAINIYPHKPFDFKESDIVFIYFIQYSGQTLQCEVVCKDNNFITYVHLKTTPLKDEENDMIYSTDCLPGFNRSMRLTKPVNNVQEKIAYFYKADKVYYQDNEVGELVNSYIKWCNQ